MFEDLLPAFQAPSTPLDQSNSDARIPLIFLMDSSGSMCHIDPASGQTAMSLSILALNNVIADLLNPQPMDILDREQANFDFCFANFDTQPKVFQPWAPYDTLPRLLPPISPSGGTALGLAILFGVKLYVERLRDYRREGMPRAKQGVLVVATDGQGADLVQDRQMNAVAECMKAINPSPELVRLRTVVLLAPASFIKQPGGYSGEEVLRRVFPDYATEYHRAEPTIAGSQIIKNVIVQSIRSASQMRLDEAVERGLQQLKSGAPTPVPGNPIQDF